MMEEYKGQVFSTVVDARQNENGRWYVIHTITQQRSKDLNEWEERRAEFIGENRNRERAIAEALYSSMMYLESKGNDLFNESEVDKSLLN